MAATAVERALGDGHRHRPGDDREHRIATNRLFVATDRVGITIVEMETGNTMNFSQ